MPKAVVKPGRVYGIERHPEGTVLEVTSGELLFFRDWLAPVDDEQGVEVVADVQEEQDAEKPPPVNDAYASTLMSGATIKQVKKFVTSGQLTAEEALTFESSEDGANRASLISWLEKHGDTE